MASERKRDWRTYDLGPKPLSEFLALDGQGEWVGRVDAERLLAEAEAENAKLREVLQAMATQYTRTPIRNPKLIVSYELLQAGLDPGEVLGGE